MSGKYEKSMKKLMAYLKGKRDQIQINCMNTSQSLPAFVQCMNNSQKRAALDAFVTGPFQFGMEFVEMHYMDCIETKQQEECLKENAQVFKETMMYLKQESKQL